MHGHAQPASAAHLRCCLLQLRIKEMVAHMWYPETDEKEDVDLADLIQEGQIGFSEPFGFPSCPADSSHHTSSDTCQIVQKSAQGAEVNPLPPLLGGHP